MADPALASISDLEARMGSTVSDATRAQAALVDASALIRAESGSEDWLDVDGALEAVPDLIVSVCCKVAQRALTNPDGVTSEAIGSYQTSYGNGSSDVYLTKAERRLVRKAAGTTPIGSIEMESPYRKYTTDDIYMTVDNGGEALPMGPWPAAT